MRGVTLWHVSCGDTHATVDDVALVCSDTETFLSLLCHAYNLKCQQSARERWDTIIQFPERLYYVPTPRCSVSSLKYVWNLPHKRTGKLCNMLKKSNSRWWWSCHVKNLNNLKLLKFMSCNVSSNDTILLHTIIHNLEIDVQLARLFIYRNMDILQSIHQYINQSINI